MQTVVYNVMQIFIAVSTDYEFYAKYCNEFLPPKQLSVNATRLQLSFLAPENDGHHKGFQIRYKIQLVEDDDTGMCVCMRVCGF